MVGNPEVAIELSPTSESPVIQEFLRIDSHKPTYRYQSGQLPRGLFLDSFPLTDHLPANDADRVQSGSIAISGARNCQLSREAPPSVHIVCPVCFAPLPTQPGRQPVWDRRWQSWDFPAQRVCFAASPPCH